MLSMAKELMHTFSVCVKNVNQYSVYKINVYYHTFRYMTERKYSNIMQSDILFNSVEFISILAIYLYL